MGRNRNPIRQGRVLAALAGLLLLPPVCDAKPAFTVGQTMRWLREETEGTGGDSWISYTSVSFRDGGWTARGSVSWLSWSPDAATADLSPERSGPGAFYFLAGRRLWHTYAPERSCFASGWVRLRGKLPLQDEPSPIGSGRADWGASFLADMRFHRVSLLAEAGFLILGDSGNVPYRDPVTGALSVGYDPPALPLKPFASLLVSSSTRQGDPAYLEVSGGASLDVSRRFTVGGLLSHGVTDVSPREGVALSLFYRP